MKWALALLFLLQAGFANAQQTQPPTSGTKGRVVLVDRVEPQLTHNHLGVTIFSTAESKIDNDWHIERFAVDSATSLLRDAGYDVVEVSADSMPADGAGGSRKAWVQALTDWVRRQLRTNGASYVVFLGSITRPYGPMVNGGYSGYGVMSQMGDPPKRVWIYSNVGASAWSGEQPKEIRKHGWYHDCRKQVDESALGSGSFKEWTAETLLPERDGIKALVTDSLRQDLISLGLLPESGEKPCVFDQT
jgi:hypothetical protein